MSPDILAGIFAVSVIVIARVLIDIRVSIASRHNLRDINAYLETHYQPTISVVIELDRSSARVMPLLDHLRESGDRHLDVIVLVKQTAGKYAIDQINAYRTRHKWKSLRAIKHAKGLSVEKVFGEHAKGSLVMSLGYDQRLSRDFWTRTRRAFLDNNTSIVIPRFVITPDHTIRSALFAGVVNWYATIRQIFRRVRVESLRAGYVARRGTNHGVALVVPASTIECPPTHSPRNLRHHIASVEPHPIQLLLPIIVLAVAFGVVIWVATQQFDPTSSIYVIAGYVALYSIVQLGVTTRYSATERLSILLLSPVTLIAAIFYALPVISFKPRNTRSRKRHFIRYSTQ